MSGFIDAGLVANAMEAAEAEPVEAALAIRFLAEALRRGGPCRVGLAPGVEGALRRIAAEADAVLISMGVDPEYVERLERTVRAARSAGGTT